MLGGSRYSHMKEETLAQNLWEHGRGGDSSEQDPVPAGASDGASWRCLAVQSDPGWSWPHVEAAGA